MRDSISKKFLRVDSWRYDGNKPTTMAKRILITAFKPFGIVGSILKYNPSEEMLKELIKVFPESDEIHYLVLPVDDTAVPSLRAEIRSFDPSYVISLGQGTSFQIETECHRRTKRKTSQFAESLIENIKILKEHSQDSSIGDYYCNDVYYAALLLVPNSLFIHLPIIQGPLKEYYRKIIIRIIEYIKV